MGRTGGDAPSSTSFGRACAGGRQRGRLVQLVLVGAAGAAACVPWRDELAEGDDEQDWSTGTWREETKLVRGAESETGRRGTG